MNVSVVIPVYNESKRIETLLNSIVGYCADVIVINKSSTDDTKLIVSELFPSVKIVDYPYAARGVDDFKSYVEHANNDWVFICVASETIPKRFWDKFRLITDEKLSDIDLLMVPRLYYCFEENIEHSPWDVSFFPFCFNKNRIIYTDILHAPFTVNDELRRYYLNYNRNEMIIHRTHINSERFIESSINYSIVESSFVNKDNVDKKIRECIENIYEGNKKFKKVRPGVESVQHYAAWNFYWSIQLLKFAEISRGCNSNNSKVNFLKIPIKKKILFRCKFFLHKLQVRSAVLRVFYSYIKNRQR